MEFIYLFICIGVGWWAHIKKGRSGIGFFLLSLFLTPIVGGIILLIVRADQKTVDNIAVQDGDKRKCPFCAEIIKSEASVCRYCHSELTPPDTPEEIIMVDSHKKTMVGEYTKYE